MAKLLMTAVFALLLAPTAWSDDQDVPTTDALETVFIDCIAHEDPVAFAQCWMSAIEMVELMESLAKIEPGLADETIGLDQLLEEQRERNRRIHHLYQGIQAAIQEHDLNMDGVSVDFGEVRKREFGALVRYEVRELFELRSEDGWVLKIEIDDVLSFGGEFRFFDHPFHAELTLADGQKVEVYNSGQHGIEWFDEEDED